MFGPYSSAFTMSLLSQLIRFASNVPLSALNLPPDCINLGQGYMNFSPPTWVTKAAEMALASVEGNHYSHPKGRPRLRQAISKHYSPSFGRKLNPDTEILVTSGANEGGRFHACSYQSRR
jgi:aspartate/methionine/tyrosine aminotransferase